MRSARQPAPKPPASVGGAFWRCSTGLAFGPRIVSVTVA